MIIKRDGRITSITARNCEYKITTAKFDDIIGTSNDALPDGRGVQFIDPMGESYPVRGTGRSLNFVVNFNNEKMSLGDILEFADMEPVLFANSLLKASSRIITREYLIDLTKQYLLFMQTRAIFGENKSRVLSGALDYGSIFTSMGAGEKQLPVISVNGAGDRKTNVDINQVMENGLAYQEKLITIRNVMSAYLSAALFADLEGNIYTLPSLTVEEIDAGIKKVIVSKPKDSWIKSPQVNVNIYELIKLPCTLLKDNLIRLIDKDGNRVVKTVPEVLPEVLSKALKSYGKNGLLSRMSEVVTAMIAMPKITKPNRGE